MITRGGALNTPASLSHVRSMRHRKKRQTERRQRNWRFHWLTFARPPSSVTLVAFWLLESCGLQHLPRKHAMCTDYNCCYGDDNQQTSFCSEIYFFADNAVVSCTTSFRCFPMFPLNLHIFFGFKRILFNGEKKSEVSILVKEYILTS